MATRTRKTTKPKGKRMDVPRTPPPEEIADETRAADLLPPDHPYVPPAKRVAERRVAGWATSERLLARRARRPAGNSRRFWSRVEDDDPFLPRPAGARMAEGDAPPPIAAHDVYAANRLSRVETGKGERPPAQAHKEPPRPPSPPKPKPPPPRRAEPVDDGGMEHAADPRPAAPPPPKPRPAPPPAPTRLDDEATTVDSPRPAPRPPPPRPPPQAPPAKPAVDRTPPRIAQPQGRPGGGRVGATPARPDATVSRALVDHTGRGSAEVRKEREDARRGPQFPPRKSLDDYLGIMGELAASEKLYREGKLLKEQEEEEAARAPAPQPKTAAPRPAPPRPPPPRPPPPRAPAARPAVAAFDEEDDLDLPPSPPSPQLSQAAKPAPKDAPVNRSPKAAMNGGSSGTGMDDLFGGPQEGRVKIPKRAPPKTPKDEQSG